MSKRQAVYFFQRQVVGWLLLFLASFTGCSGCRREPTVAEEGEKKPTRPISYSEFRSLPAEATSKALLCKPGHVMQARQGLKANQEDLQCWIESAIRDTQNQPIPMPGTRWYTNYSRPAALPKGTTKNLDLRLLITPTRTDDPNSLAAKPFVNFRVIERGVGTAIDEKAMPTVLLPSFQYQLMILSEQPLRLEYWRAMDCVAWLTDDLDFGDPTIHYRVVLADGKDGDWQIPDQFVAMTSTAYLIIDDLDPSVLNPDQQKAILDWLHWGGCIILNGPAAWGKWQESFLKPHLPFANAESGRLSADLMGRLDRKWTLPRRASSITGLPSATLDNLRLPTDREVPSLTASLGNDGAWVSYCDDLVAEKFVGRGRVAVTTFPIHDPMFVQWPSFSSFCNAVLLRRPARQWKSSEDLIDDFMVWDGPLEGFERDSRLVSNLRIFSRDASLRSRKIDGADQDYDMIVPPGRGVSPESIDPNDIEKPAQNTNRITRELEGVSPFASHMQWEDNTLSGVGGWSDFSSISVTALAAVKESSGINVPRISVIIQLLVGYLIVLVPINWIIFKLIGRLEWAWLAAPVIAMVGVVVVTRVAQLDIGFARSQTEVGVMEIQGNYNRAHLTRFVAMYSSLSTNYKVLMDPDNAMIQPCAGDDRQLSNSSGQLSAANFVYGEGDQDQLTGFRVISNTTSLLHTEQMMELGGGITLERDNPEDVNASDYRLMNRSTINIENSGIIRRTSSGQIQVAWVGNCGAGKVADVQFKDILPNAVWFKEWDVAVQNARAEAAEFVEGNRENLIDLRPLFRIAIRNLPLDPGHVRLIGEVRDRQGGLDIIPASTSLTQKTLLVAHLESAFATPVQFDKELRARSVNVDRGADAVGDPAEEIEP